MQSHEGAALMSVAGKVEGRQKEGDSNGEKFWERFGQVPMESLSLGGSGEQTSLLPEWVWAWSCLAISAWEQPAGGVHTWSWIQKGSSSGCLPMHDPPVGRSSEQCILVTTALLDFTPERQSRESRAGKS